MTTNLWCYGYVNDQFLVSNSGLSTIDNFACEYYELRDCVALQRKILASLFPNLKKVIFALWELNYQVFEVFKEHQPIGEVELRYLIPGEGIILLEGLEGTDLARGLLPDREQDETLNDVGSGFTGLVGR